MFPDAIDVMLVGGGLRVSKGGVGVGQGATPYHKQIHLPPVDCAGLCCLISAVPKGLGNSAAVTSDLSFSPKKTLL